MEFLELANGAATIIALYAALNAAKARKEAKSANQKAQQLQERVEKYEYFPIVKAVIETNGSEISLTITNTNSRNVVSGYRVHYILRIRTNTGHFELEKFKQEGAVIQPGESITLIPGAVNEVISDAIPSLKRSAGNPDNNFVVRAYLECDPPHPDSEKIKTDVAAFFEWKNERLELIPPKNKANKSSV